MSVLRRPYHILNSKLILGAAVSAAFITLPAHGAMITDNSYQVAPQDLNVVTGFSSDGSVPLGSDTVGTVDNNSFESAVDGVSGARPYSGVIFTPTAIGMTGLTMNELTGLTFDTEKVGGPTTGSGTDWSLRIYTVPQPGDPPNFYSARVDFNPDSIAIQSGFITSNINTLSLFGVKQAGESEVYADPSGNYATAESTVAESNPAATIGNEPIEYIELLAGNQTPGPAIDSYLDNIVATETLPGGDQVVSSINLVPEPGVLGGATLACAPLLLMRRPRRQK
jgi:hypothetical protein